MSREPLPRFVTFLLAQVAPEDWRDSIEGDLAEERHRRKKAGRYAGGAWLAAAALTSAVQLRIDRRKSLHTSPIRGFSRCAAAALEIRDAFRAVLRRPAFAAITILTLTLGIGANTAVFSLANWLMFRPVPGVERVDGLVTIRLELENARGFVTMTLPEVGAVGKVTGLSGAAGRNEIPLHIAAAGAIPARVNGEIVTSNYFAVLGQRLTLGRGFSTAEDDPGHADVVVISDRFWHETFGSDPNVLGRSVAVNGHPFTVVGVAAHGFRGPDRNGRADVWVPIASFRSSMPSYPATLLTGGASVFFSVIGRMAPGSSTALVNDQLTAMRTSLLAAAGGAKFKRASFVAKPGLEAPPWQRNGLRQMFTLLLSVVSLLLVLTCANVANLLFAHAHERRGELATRQALGASRARVARQLLLEALLLAGLGGALAVGAAAIMGARINGMVVAQNIPALSTVQLDWRVFAFAAAVAIATCVCASLLPALFGSRIDLIASLKETGRGQMPAGRRIRRILTTVQVAVAVALLAVGLLLVRSMTARYNVPLGFDTDRVLAFSVEPGLQGYKKDQQKVFFQELLRRVGEQPGVDNAGLAWIEPFRMIGGDTALKPAGQTDMKEVSADANYVSRGFFPSLGVKLISGRDFTDAETFRSDEGGGGVLIVSESLARALFGSSDAAGRSVEMSYPKGRIRTIVGVVADTRTRTIGNAPVDPVAYEPIGQDFAPSWATVHVRLNTRAAAVIPAIRQTMLSIDPQLPIYDIELLSASVDRYFAEQRLVANTIATFAVLATLVAALGLYGVLARGVAERRREFGIRAALGANPSMMARLVAREALTLTLVGATAGLTLAGLLSRAIQARLFGVSPIDPVSLLIALAVVMAVAIAASFAPARRAARVDVVNELR